MKVFGSIGRIGSGKDAVVKYLSKRYGLPVVSVGDMVRERAAEEGLSPTRKELHRLSSRMIREHGKEYFMALVLKRIEDRGWEKAGITGIRTPEDVRFLRSRLGDGLVLFHVYVGDDHTRFERMRRRNSPRDPQTYEDFLEEDREEEAMFRIEGASAMADYSLDNSGSLEDLHGQVDAIVEDGAALEAVRGGRHDRRH